MRINLRLESLYLVLPHLEVYLEIYPQIPEDFLSILILLQLPVFLALVVFLEEVNLQGVLSSQNQVSLIMVVVLAEDSLEGSTTNKRKMKKKMMKVMMTIMLEKEMEVLQPILGTRTLASTKKMEKTQNSRVRHLRKVHTRKCIISMLINSK